MQLILACCALVLLIDVLLILLWNYHFLEGEQKESELPKISILIAARNEENNIVDCLDSLLRLDYPSDKLEILIGNDGSTDRTKSIIEAYDSQYEFVMLIDIKEKVGQGNGKANVLAQLSKIAQGDLYFFTDADITVPSTWIWGMLGGLDHDTGLVTGTSVVEGVGFLARYQKIDWLFATGMLKVISDLGIPVTSMGNNMMVRKESYWQTGGYEKLSFSVTEDLELFKKVQRNSKVVNLFGPQVLNVSKPIDSWGSLLIQRKRWMKGAFGLHPLMIFILLVQTTSIAFFMGLIVLFPMLGFPLTGLHFMFRYWFVHIVGAKINRQVDLISSFVFEFVNALFMLTAMAYYFFSGPVKWKGREY